MKKNRGFTLIELSIVILIMTLLAAYKIREESRDLRLGLAKAQGEQLKVLGTGLYNYGLAHFSDLVNGVNIAGVAVDTAPTVAELKTLGFLDTSFNPNTAYGGGYLTQIEKSPAACTTNCNLAGLAYLAQPLIDPMDGAVDGPAIGQAVNAMGADGGASIPAAANIKGKSGGWTVPNPLNQVGIIGLRVGEGSALDMSAYLKRDGSFPMTGSLNMGSNTVTNLAAANIGDVCATPGSVASGPGGEVLSCQGGTYQPQGSAYWKEPVSTKAALDLLTCDAASAWHTRIVQMPSVGNGPRPYTCDGASWIPLAVDDLGNMTIAGTVSLGKAQINDIVTAGTGCPSNGLMARDTTGMPLFCQSGLWTGGGSETAGQYAYYNAATCPSGWVAANGANGTVDLRGEFIRGFDNGRGVDPSRVLASWQNFEIQAHSHSGGLRLFSNPAGQAASSSPNYVNYAQTGTTGGAETRPRNVALLACMKQ